MEKRIAMLLNGEVNNDYRVIKMIRTLSKNVGVDLYYVNGVVERDKLHFDTSVRLKSIGHSTNFKVKLLRHSYFCFEFNFLMKEVVRSKEEYQLIWANDLPTLYPAWKLSVHFGCPLVYDSHEIYTETINQFFPRYAVGIKKWITKSLIRFMRKHGEKTERKIFSQMDAFITVNHSLLNYYTQKYAPKAGYVIMNLPIQSEIKITQKVDYRTLYNWKSSDKIILYQGAFNEGRGLRFLPDVMKLLPDHIKLILIGDGPLKVELQQLFSVQDRVKYIATVSLADLANYTAGADIGINLLESFNLSKKFASPNKLFEYIHADLPIVATDTIENRKVLDEFMIGTLTNNDPVAIAKAIRTTLDIENDAFQPGFENAKRTYRWESQEDTIDSMLLELMTKP